MDSVEDAKTKTVQARALFRSVKSGRVASVARLLARRSSWTEWERQQALMMATWYGHAAVVEQLIAAGANITYPQSGDFSPLEDASLKGHLDVVEVLLRAGAQSDRGRAWRHEVDAALEVAAQRGHTAVVARLRAAGGQGRHHVLRMSSLKGNVDLLLCMVQDRGTHEPHSAAAATEALLVACHHCEADRVADLLDRADIHVSKDLPLFIASREGHLSVVELLLAAGANVDNHPYFADAGYVDGPLTAAAEYGHLAVVERLIAAGAAYDKRRPGDRWRGPLLLASGAGHTAVVAALLAADSRPLPPSDPEDGGDRDGSCASRAPSASSPPSGRPPSLELLESPQLGAALEQACARGHAPVVALLLQAAGPDLVAGEHRRASQRALVKACEGGHLAVVELLLAAGVMPEAGGDGTGPSPLAASCTAGHLPVLEKLLAAGIEVNSEVNIALCCAAGRGHVAIVERLLSAGAHAVDVHAQSDKPLRQASAGGHVTVVDMLLSAGAYVNAGGGGVAAPTTRGGSWDPPENGPALVTASRNGHLAVVNRLLQATDVDIHIDHDAALAAACSRGHGAVVGRLLDAGAIVHLQSGLAEQLASENGHAAVVQQLLRAGADGALIEWDGLDVLDWPHVVQCIRPTHFSALPAGVQPLWVRFHLRWRRRLAPAVQRARDRLDRPPSVRLATAQPTREELIAHLLTAGRRFAREYWTDGLPLFFPDRLAELGPIPEVFVHVQGGTEVGEKINSAHSYAPLGATSTPAR